MIAKSGLDSDEGILASLISANDVIATRTGQFNLEISQAAASRRDEV